MPSILNEVKSVGINFIKKRQRKGKNKRQRKKKGKKKEPES